MCEIGELGVSVKAKMSFGTEVHRNCHDFDKSASLDGVFGGGQKREDVQEN